MPDTKIQRLYTRYSFSAEVEVADSLGIKILSRIKTIGYGGCCVIAKGVVFRVGIAVTLKVHTPDEFESTGTIVYSNAQEMGVLFGTIGPQSLLVLRKWIDSVR